MRNAKYPSFLVGEGDTRFFDVTGLTDAEIDTVVNDYLTLPARGGTQPRPAMFSMLMQSFYNIVDSYFVAKVSEDAFTAVSLAFPRMISVSFSE